MTENSVRASIIRANKEEFCRLLRSTQREGIDYVIEDLEKLGFFEAPASTHFHLSQDGGLVEHSLNVCRCAMRLRETSIAMRPDLAEQLREDSVILSALLHDVNKADIYKPTVKRRFNKLTGKTEDYATYDVDYSHFPMGHGEKSVIVLLLSGLMLRDEEMLAIRWHMAAWDLPFHSPEARSNLNTARDLHPLCGLIQCADTLASSVIEHTDKVEI